MAFSVNFLFHPNDEVTFLKMYYFVILSNNNWRTNYGNENVKTLKCNTKITQSSFSILNTGKRIKFAEVAVKPGLVTKSLKKL